MSTTDIWLYAEAVPNFDIILSYGLRVSATTVTPDILTDRRGHPIAAQSLYVALIRRYGVYEGERIYYEMAREHKGPFAAGAKYAHARPRIPTTPAVPQRGRLPRVAPPPRRN